MARESVALRISHSNNLDFCGNAQSPGRMFALAIGETRRGTESYQPVIGASADHRRRIPCRQSKETSRSWRGFCRPRQESGSPAVDRVCGTTPPPHASPASQLGEGELASPRQHVLPNVVQGHTPIFFIFGVSVCVGRTARDLGCPSALHVLILLVQAREQLGGNFGTIVRRELKYFFEQSIRFLRHRINFTTMRISEALFVLRRFRNACVAIVRTRG